MSPIICGGNRTVVIEVEGKKFTASPEQFRELRDKLNRIRFVDEDEEGDNVE